MGISVTDETLERATRVKRLIGRPQESAQSERKSTSRYGDEYFSYKEEVNGYFNNEHAFFIHIEIEIVFLEKEFNGLM
ncbi:hypothetical protein ABE61_23495 [Lysinibacillus sphaericus]|uniref:hypothetical protein n=1 Tax=Lysinibacillus sphaericus TaxID=1421 RepID=UPI0018CF3299|nr:hypothetical protein [Lysinibacillus sphaericus]MBG9456862.1 hypothetical protein [Lysinibacillus sphaericus]MBG9480541.1 hypothetical protein [Lysinibacillus sphaericus]MBG9595166.1 hypothetical protein [Lysinibacillus sphaericus]